MPCPAGSAGSAIVLSVRLAFLEAGEPGHGAVGGVDPGGVAAGHARVAPAALGLEVEHAGAAAAQVLGGADPGRVAGQPGHGFRVESGFGAEALEDDRHPAGRQGGAADPAGAVDRAEQRPAGNYRGRRRDRRPAAAVLAQPLALAPVDRGEPGVEGGDGAPASRSEGAVLVKASGCYYPPTLLTGVAPDAAILADEIFGPVAPVVVWNDEDELPRWANDTEYGLAAYVYAGRLQDAVRLAEALDAGMVGINRGVVSDPSTPFGGMKQSGLGREGARIGMHEFQETQYFSVAFD